MRVINRLDSYQREHRWAGLALAVFYKLIEDQATSLAAMITYYGMVSLFPLLLLLTTCLGFALANDPDLQQTVLHSALREFPVLGDQLGENVHSLSGSSIGLAVGIAGSLYGALGVSLAIQNAMNRIWAIPRAERPDLVRGYGRGLALLAVLALDIGITATLAAAIAALEESIWGFVAFVVPFVGTIASLAVNVGLVLLAYRILTVHGPSPWALWPGALTAALLWQVLLGTGTYLVGHQLSRATATYGMFGIVLGLLTWIYLGALILILGAEINVVRLHRLHPRSLLAPDPRAGSLTPADERSFARYPQTERHKIFHVVRSHFRPPDTHSGGRSPDVPVPRPRTPDTP